MGTTVRRASGAAMLAHSPGIRAVYAEAFAGPPWHEGDAEARHYQDRLAADTARPGFTGALALGADRDVLGFATAFTSATPLPVDRSYACVTAALGAERAGAWLCGGLEVDELAVRPRAHRGGLGAALLDAVTREADDGRCWLLTSARAGATLRFYRRLGWHQATHPAPGGGSLAVFLGPRHPARDSTASPL
ncbi:GNAT family N-acetyltransferase [Streptomyces sp. A5-4]|uniref:GNAT family N-acetyltransferase n=1 Tax=Streptomyces sp. A5-4 TaxID=3384771 RepID=UPI003DA87C5D